MKHIMFDCETTGLSYDHNAMIQISAVRFDLETGEIDTNFFDECLMIPPGRYWDEGTRTWWSQMPEVFENIWKRMRNPEDVMREFVQWVRLGDDDPIFWSKPLSFDFPFLESYCRQYGVSNPFFFRRAENMNTWIRSRYFPEPAPEWDKILPFEGDEHYALRDVLHQVKALLKAYEDTK